MRRQNPEKKTRAQGQRGGGAEMGSTTPTPEKAGGERGQIGKNAMAKRIDKRLNKQIKQK